jgi:hypothetical protein
MNWQAFEIVNDRLKRWYIADTDAPGRGKPVIATYIRKGDDAKVMAGARRMEQALLTIAAECRNNSETMGEAGGVVHDLAMGILRAIKGGY